MNITGVLIVGTRYGWLIQDVKGFAQVIRALQSRHDQSSQCEDMYIDRPPRPLPEQSSQSDSFFSPSSDQIYAFARFHSLTVSLTTIGREVHSMSRMSDMARRS